MMHRLATVLLWLAGFGFVFAGLHINEPYLVSLHGFGVGFVLLASLGVFFVLRARAVRGGATIARLALVGLWGLPAPAIGYADLAYAIGKQRVLHTGPATARLLGPHFVVGYSSLAEVSRLSEQGLIGGIYVTRHNLAGKTPAALASEIASLQKRRRAAGLPPWRVAADQEGGIVSHLAPPLTELPALASLVELPPAIRADRAFAFGRDHCCWWPMTGRQSMHCFPAPPRRWRAMGWIWRYCRTASGGCGRAFRRTEWPLEARLEQSVTPR